MVGFAIKMVPLGFVSQTLFPCFMGAHFGVLALAFWMNLAFFGMSNKTLLPPRLRLRLRLRRPCPCRGSRGEAVPAPGHERRPRPRDGRVPHPGHRERGLQPHPLLQRHRIRRRAVAEPLEPERRSRRAIGEDHHLIRLARAKVLEACARVHSVWLYREGRCTSRTSTAR